jgi:hypothetical protein
MSEDSVTLTGEQAHNLACRLIALHLEDTDWLQWEELPNLTEGSFDLVVEAVAHMARGAADASVALDRVTGIDSQWLHAEAVR